MPVVRVSTTLPYALGLPDGEYATAAGAPGQEEIAVAQSQPDEHALSGTVLSATFEHPNGLDADAIEKCRNRDVDRLLRRANRLLRWCRAESSRREVLERTRAQASPFTFKMVSAGNSAEWEMPLFFEEQGPRPLEWPATDLAELVRAGLASGREPDVDVLFLLDAERAIEQGRFREAILFCWSTIDSVFTSRFEALANAALLNEWAGAREFITDYAKFGLRQRMSLGMRIVARRSLFAEPDNLWNRLSASYDKRNNIIHRGENASEDEATAALGVARALVRIMREVAIDRAAANPAAGPLLIE